MGKRSIGVAVRANARIYEASQRGRIQMENRLLAVEQERSEQPKVTIARWERWRDGFALVEHEAEEAMADDLEFHPVWPWFQVVKGIGVVMATRILGEIVDISTFETVSQLWRYAMGAPVEGKVERAERGKKNPWSKRLKTAVYQAGRQMLMAQGQYSRFYYEAKERYQVSRPEWTKGHIDLAALRKMNKVWLSHVWCVWRAELGLRTRPLWVIQHGGHDGVIRPQDVVVGYEYPVGMWEGKTHGG